ncbi:MAG TPA: NADAR family protein [Candidatus Sulfotelmatobacter sp.]|jgi:ribA/ribD-fused uncharacterized protein|nr:NADAR family protein [Candidatus Sulfotelmatobacter sp.]
MTDSIQGFAGTFAFLSNLYPSPIEWKKFLFPTVENAFQAAKTVDSAAWERLTELSPDAAAAFGRTVSLRSDWDEARLLVMAELLALKFEIPALRRRLIATHPRPLINDAWWGDRFWGVTRGAGENHLGRLLMERRAALSERDHSAAKCSR